MFAMDFLRPQNKVVAGDNVSGQTLAKGKHVVVIGGGDTGSDCVGTSNRHGAVSVTQIELMPKPPEHENVAMTWPYWPAKLRTSSSHDEGVDSDWDHDQINQRRERKSNQNHWRQGRVVAR